MARNLCKAGSEQSCMGSLPMSAAVWDEIATSFKFSPQQKRIVACVLCGYQDKQIACELGLSIPTIRTYLSRIFAKTGAADRMQLVLKLFAIAQLQISHACQQA